VRHTCSDQTCLPSAESAKLLLAEYDLGKDEGCQIPDFPKLNLAKLVHFYTVDLQHGGSTPPISTNCNFRRFGKGLPCSLAGCFGKIANKLSVSVDELLK